ncbi:MAG: GspE/PulE family protein [Candidatus Buchananbacteria bacterium]|jgi:type IV pilus assembly protein PilB
MADTKYQEKLKALLLSKALIDEAKFAASLVKAEKTNQDIDKVLIDDKIVPEKAITAAKGEIYNLPVADLSETEVPVAVLNLLPQKVAENYQAVIFDSHEGKVKVGLVDPGNFLAHEAINFLAQENGWQTEYFVISIYDFRRLLQRYGGAKIELTTALESAEEKFASKELEIPSLPAEQLDEKIKTAPVAKIVSVIIRNAVEGRASDIHIEPGRVDSRVRYRVDGILHTSLTLPAYLHNAVVSRIKVMANLKLDETRVPQDGRIRSRMDGHDVDLRVSVLPMLNSEKVVIRVLDTSAGVPTLEQLGFSAYHIEILKRNITKPFGVVLLTGPTGSGKTTTLYSVLNMLRGDDTNITTLEDPIEYYVDGVNQSQINVDVGFTFADGLRAILRQDPNVIMVGEIRDNDTAELVIHAGLTGHMVFSTLHTNNAWGAIPRMIDMHAEPFLLASTLNLVIAQRLVRGVCQECKEVMALPAPLLARIKEELAIVPKEYLGTGASDFKFYRGKGCSACSNTGYQGRTVIAELLEVGTELKDIIAEEKFDSKKIAEQLAKQKYVTLMQDGLVKAMNGLTSVDEVMRVTQM